VPPTAPPAKQAVPEARAYVLVDAGTGNVLAGYREHAGVPPASLTKVVTALVAVGYLAPDETVPGTVSSESAYPNQVGIEKGVKWPLDEILGSLLVYSANDAAYAIADQIGGSLAGFAPIMQLAAREMRMSDHPVLRDPAGLDGTEGFDGGNLLSARDLAIAGRDLLAVPLLAQIVRKQSYDFVDPTGEAHDLPSMDYTFLSSYPGAIGIKTGFTDRAGDCLLAAARRHGRTMIAVVMDGYNPTQTAIDLLNQGFATPVSAEPTTDRLPPVLLPGPRFATQRAGALGRGAASRAGRKPVPTRGAATNSAPALEAATGKSSVQKRAAVANAEAASSVRGAPRSRSSSANSFRAVVAAWPAQVLLALSALAALFAMWQTAGANRYRQRSRH
jgi:D-alanyl-D-alanine carboxypeptidase (penicillin-binding protein 5/6)